MIAVLGGLAAGVVHVLSGPDHLAAIAPYAVDAKRSAWRTGVRWGLGHAAGLLCIALVVFWLRASFPIEAVSSLGERMVGFLMVGIGLWGIGAAMRRNRTPNVDSAHHHGPKAFAVGTLHGVGGSAHLLGILPALALPSDLAAAMYLLLFGLGGIAAMGTFAALVGWGSLRPGLGSARAQGVLMGISSVAALGIGGYWMLGGP